MSRSSHAIPDRYQPVGDSSDTNTMEAVSILQSLYPEVTFNQQTIAGKGNRIIATAIVYIGIDHSGSHLDNLHNQSTNSNFIAGTSARRIDPNERAEYRIPKNRVGLTINAFDITALRELRTNFTLVSNLITELQHQFPLTGETGGPTSGVALVTPSIPNQVPTFSLNKGYLKFTAHDYSLSYNTPNKSDFFDIIHDALGGECEARGHSFSLRFVSIPQRDLANLAKIQLNGGIAKILPKLNEMYEMAKLIATNNMVRKNGVLPSLPIEIQAKIFGDQLTLLSNEEKRRIFDFVRRGNQETYLNKGCTGTGEAPTLGTLFTLSDEIAQMRVRNISPRAESFSSAAAAAASLPSHDRSH